MMPSNTGWGKPKRVREQETVITIHRTICFGTLQNKVSLVKALRYHVKWSKYWRIIKIIELPITLSCPHQGTALSVVF
jgi:hypothetical protein